MAPRGGREVAAPRVQTVAFLIALGVASFTVAEWTFPSQLSLDFGMFGGDTTWYHMPFAARIAQEASTVHLHYTDPLRLVAWFYPQSSELIHGAAIVIFKTDWLSPLINLFWLAIALLAAWCVGRPYKVGPATLVAGAIVLDAGVMIETQPGEGRNDIMGLAFLIAFAAFLINGHQRRAPEAGAVQDTPERDAPLLDKGPAGPRRDRRRAGGLGEAHLPRPGGGDLARRRRLQRQGPPLDDRLGARALDLRRRRLLVRAGGDQDRRQPDPVTSSFGPLHLPKPDQMPLDPRPRFAVSHYLTDPTIYRRWFFPRLDNAFGPLWPLILIVAVAAAVFIALRSRNRILQVIAVAALLTAAVYLFTPLTAAGQEGSPTGFFTNTRYLVPGLVLAMTLLPIARPLRAPDSRAWQTLLFLLGVYAITVLTTPRWYPGYIVGTIFLTLALVWAPAALGLLRGRRRVSRGHVAVAAGGGAAARRGPRPRPGGPVLRPALHAHDPVPAGRRPAQGLRLRPHRHDARIGIAGSGEIFFGQYGFYGANLDNYVQYIGVPGPDGAYRLATSCAQFHRLINAGHYDFLIVSQATQDSREAEYWYPIYAWLKNDPALELVIEEPEITPEPDYVFKVKGKLDPSCADVGKG